eukprot:m.103756 g.103756  ORF g.103756 m.103756 type:complete len:963 (-) comp27515_c0_seq4:240-3128(-)
MFGFVAVVTCSLTFGSMSLQPVVPPEATMVWPQPQSQTVGDRSGYISSRSQFQFVAANAMASSSSVLREAFARYEAVLFQHIPEPMTWVGRCHTPPCPGQPAVPSKALVVGSLEVVLRSSDESLDLETCENYTLSISFPNATLTAVTAYGALRGLETFSQLVQPDYSIREQVIDDFPRFPFRGILIDSARHFLSVPLLQAHLDAMAYNKMNVLHWHIVDMPSFPFVSTSFPQLAANGAFDSNHVYTPQDISSIIAYAKARGIRVVPEFDVPGHTFPSWDFVGVMHDNSTLLTKCAQYNSVGGYGPLRVDLESTYEFLTTLFTELSTVFPDAVFNIGGDEVSTGCWEENPDVSAFMKRMNLSPSNLTVYFAKKVFAIVNTTMKKSPMMWRPGIGDLVSPADTPPDAIYDVYGPMPGLKGYNDSATVTTKNGFRVVRSANYYLDQLCTGDPDGKHDGTYWGYFQGFDYYNYDPIIGEIDEKAGGRPELVIGGKANMWGEHVDNTNFMPRVWPRTSVLAERFWSAAAVNDTAVARMRLHEFRCRLTRRGIDAQPIGSLAYSETGPYHTAFCQHDSDAFTYSPPVLPPAGWQNMNIKLSVPRSRLASASSGDVVVFAGGLTADGPSDVVDIFDFSTHPPTHTTDTLSAPRVFDGGQNIGVSLAGKLYFGGGAGVNASCNPKVDKCATTQSAVVDIFDVKTKRFDPTPPPLSLGRSFLAAVAVEAAGLVLFGGGELMEDEKHPSSERDASVVDVWSATQKAWLTPMKLSVGRKKLTAVALGDIAIFAGGFTSDVNQNNCGGGGSIARPGMGCYRREVDIFNTSSHSWSTAMLAQGRMRLASAADEASNCVLFAGGEVNTTHNDASGIVDIFCNGEWSIAELSTRRYELSSVALGGKIVFAGGNGGDGDGNPAAGARVDIFDGATRSWSTNTLPTPQSRLAAAAVTTKELVCFGGAEGDGVIDCLGMK